MTNKIHHDSSQRETASNNFDLIRLFAALQVAITHAAEHLHVDFLLLPALKYFPGVPIFFFISGYLIYQSHIKTRDVRSFFFNRFIRIYPALYLCFLLTVASVYLSGFSQNREFGTLNLLQWAISTLTFFQFYNPEFLRGYGVGSINGSLWTISVELQFYLLTPVIFILLNKKRTVFLTVTAILVLANLTNTFFNTKHSTIEKLAAVTFAPWIYMFIAGAYASTKKKLIEKITDINPFLYGAAYLISYYIADRYHLGTGNGVNPISFFLLGCTVLSFAYNKPGLSSRVLGNNDISYGVYIYHMPIINFFLFTETTILPVHFGLTLALTIGFATTSWFLLEKRALKLKRYTLRNF